MVGIENGRKEKKKKNLLDRRKIEKIEERGWRRKEGKGVVGFFFFFSKKEGMV